jgi:hypothetical protein
MWATDDTSNHLIGKDGNLHRVFVWYTVANLTEAIKKLPRWNWWVVQENEMEKKHRLKITHMPRPGFSDLLHGSASVVFDWCKQR